MSASQAFRGLSPSSDDGFSLMEVIVSMVIFELVALIMAGLIINTIHLTRSNTARTVAANLVAQQIEAMRDTRTLDIPDGQTTLPAQTVGGTTFTLTQTADYVVGGAATSACTGSGDRLAYELITVVATWPNMGAVQPVRSDTLRSLGIGSGRLDAARGTLAVAIQGEAGQPQADVPVTVSHVNATRTTLTTGVGGCALFLGLDPALTYTVTVDKPGYVGIEGSQQVTVPNAVDIQAAKITRTVVNYQQKGALAVRLLHPDGFLPPAGLALTVSNSLFTPGNDRAFPDCAGVATAPQGCVSGTPRTAALYPGKYGAWAGTCSDAKPAPAPSLTDVQPGVTARARAGLGGVPIQVRKAGLPITGKTVYAVHAGAPGCPAGESWPLLRAGDADLQAALPKGTWTLSLSSAVPPTTGPVVTITPGTVLAPVVVLAP